MGVAWKFRELFYRMRTQLMQPDRIDFHGMILMLHRIVEDKSEYQYPNIAQLHVTARHLEALLVDLRARGYEIVSLDELYSILKGRAQKRKFVVFTFDDAYRDTYDLAFPIFSKHSAPFTVYVPTSVPDQHFLWWYYMLDDLVYNNDAIEIPIGQELYCFNMRSVEQKNSAYNSLETIINSINPHSRRKMLETVFTQFGLYAEDYAQKLSMTWNQIEHLSRSGLTTIGNHTVNHNNLAQLSIDKAVDEMKQGRDRIIQHIGGTVDHFCYPFGSKSAAHFREFDLAKGLEFKTCTTSRTGYITPGHYNYLERLPRIMVDETTTINSLIR